MGPQVTHYSHPRRPIATEEAAVKYGWPDPRDISHAVWNLAEPLPLVPMGRAYIAQSDRTILSSVIAMSIVVSAHDIVDPRLTYRGPWTEGWKPLA